MTDPILLEALASDHSQVVMSNGEVVQLKVFFDGSDQTDDPMEATAGVGQMADGRWVHVRFDMFEPRRFS